jgi:hypothetical protein
LSVPWTTEARLAVRGHGDGEIMDGEVLEPGLGSWLGTVSCLLGEICPVATPCLIDISRDLGYVVRRMIERNG